MVFVVVIAMLLVAGHAQAATAFWYEVLPANGQPGETRLYQAPANTFEITVDSPQALQLRIDYPNSANSPVLTFNAPPGDILILGPQENLQRQGVGQGNTAAFDFFIPGQFQCHPKVMRFVILEIAFDPGNHLAKLAVDFQIDCDSSGGASSRGELRINSALPLTIDKAPNSTTSDGFAFSAANPVHASSIVGSNIVGIYGINAPAPISITNGEYSINGGAFTGASGTVGNGDFLQVRMTAAASAGGSSTAIVTAGGVTQSFVATTYLPGQPYTGAQYDLAQGVPAWVERYTPNWTISAIHDTAGHVAVAGAGPDGQAFRLDLAAPRDEALSVGPYEEAKRWNVPGTGPEISFTGNSVCDAGRFVVLDADFGPGTIVNRLAVNFQLWCPTFGLDTVRGEIRVASTVPFTSFTPSPRTLPDPFGLLTQNPVRAGSLVMSNLTTLDGIDVGIPISMAGGGAYSLNGAPFTGTSGTAHDHDDVRVKLTASNVPGATVATTLTAGGRSATFSTTTFKQGAPMSGLYYRSAPGVSPGDGRAHLYLGPRNALSFSTAPWGATVVQATGYDASQQVLMLQAPGNSSLAPGRYEGAARFATPSSAGLDFSTLEGVACSESSGRFIVHEVAFDDPVDTTIPTRFAADFETACTGSPGTLYGEIRLNSIVPFSTLLRRPVTDLNVDGRGDMLWRNASSGQVYRMLMNGFAITDGGFAYSEPNTAWKIAGEGDFDNDGITDLLWRNTSTNQLYVLYVGPDGRNAGRGGYVNATFGPDWKIVQVADIDGDGQADLLWWNAVTGQVHVMLMNGTTIKRATTVYTEPDTQWRIAGAADFTRSGKQNQLVWRHASTGQVYMMTLAISDSAITPSGQVIYQEPDAAWKIVGIADFDGDGEADLLWRHDTTGRVHMMLMDGPVIRSQGAIYQEPDTSWKIVAQADYNGDGKADLLWRNETTGQVYMMLMNGLAIASQAMVYTEPDTAWKVMGPYEYAR
jgi:hypothetical protein